MLTVPLSAPDINAQQNIRLCNNVGVVFCPRLQQGMCWETALSVCNACVCIGSVEKRALPPGKKSFVSTISQSKCVTMSTPPNPATCIVTTHRSTEDEVHFVLTLT